MQPQNRQITVVNSSKKLLLHTTTSSRVSPLVPNKNLTKFPLLFSQM